MQLLLEDPIWCRITESRPIRLYMMMIALWAVPTSNAYYTCMWTLSCAESLDLRLKNRNQNKVAYAYP